MPRFPRRRRYAPKRALVRRRRLARRIPRSPRNGGFYVSRKMMLIGIAGSNSVAGLVASTNTNVITLGTPISSVTNASGYYDVPFSVTLQLDQVQGYTDLTNIADKYRIVSSHIKFILNQNTVQPGLQLPFLEIVKDADDATAPTIAQMREKMGVMTRTFVKNGTASVKVKPLPAPTVYNGISNGYMVPRRSPYINSTFYSVPHYCLKGIIRNMFIPGTSLGATCVHVDVGLNVYVKDLQ